MEVQGGDENLEAQQEEESDHEEELEDNLVEERKQSGFMMNLKASPKETFETSYLSEITASGNESPYAMSLPSKPKIPSCHKSLLLKESKKSNLCVSNLMTLPESFREQTFLSSNWERS